MLTLLATAIITGNVTANMNVRIEYQIYPVKSLIRTYIVPGNTIADKISAAEGKVNE